MPPRKKSRLTASPSITISEEQALYSRMCRAGLIHNDVSSGSGIDVGIQSQSFEESQYALRIREGFDVEDVMKNKVRVYAQRGTVHIYKEKDWNLVVAAARIWKLPSHWSGTAIPKSVIDDVRTLLKKSEDITRSDVVTAKFIPPDLVSELKKRYGSQIAPALSVDRVAAGHCLKKLCRDGECVYGGRNKSGEQIYVTKAAPRASCSDEEACLIFARRFVHLYGPCTVQDLRRYFGCSMAVARGWRASLEENDELIDVKCGEDHGDLFGLKSDVESMTVDATSVTNWPTVCLGRFDSFTLALADKTWLCPSPNEAGSDIKRIYRIAAEVMGVVLVRGRAIVAWKWKRRM